jgi:TolB-like protein
MAATYTFGPFRLDVEAEIIFRGAEPISLGRRAVALLRVLVERPGAPVSKDTLIELAWPGLAVEESNLTVQIAALRRVLGEEPGGERWIETLPRRGYRFVGPFAKEDIGLTKVAHTEVAPALAVPDKPSIAALPFQNMSGDPEQEYFAHGMVEEIITALSRTRWLFVIARNSTFTYKGRAVEVEQVSRELGVRYVLEGSVRKARDQVRISAQLIDALTSAHLWADHFDGSLDDIFDLQDRVAERVVGALLPKVERAEIERAKRKPTENLGAYDYFLRGLANAHQMTHEANSEALRLFHKAIELDPDFASAHGLAAFCHVVRKMNAWMTDDAADVAEAARLARRVADIGKDDAVALSYGGFALGYIAGELEDAAVLIDRALVLNVNLAAAWYASGTVRAFLGGAPDVAIEHLARAMRLSPLDPFMFTMQGVTAVAHFFAGRYDEASAWAEKAFREQPNILGTLRISAASHALAGRREEASKAIARALQLDPNLRMSNLNSRIGFFRRPEDFTKYAEALRKAGLPE